MTLNDSKLYIAYHRLIQKCGQFSGDLGEEVIYEEGYRKTGDLETFLCKEKTKDCVKLKDKKEEL